jgi:hypothetical protein
LKSLWHSKCNGKPGKEGGVPVKTTVARARIAILLILIGGVATFVQGCSKSALDTVTEDYRKLLVINQLNASYYTEPKTKERYPLIKGSLSNLGPKTLIVVEFTVRFKDKTRKVIHEEHAYPVYVSNFSFPEPSQVLKPGAKTPFAFKAPNCPPGWEPGAIDVEITKVVLSNAV